MGQATTTVEKVLEELQLSSECIDMKPVDFDWQDSSGWQVAEELTTCPKCNGEGKYDCEKCDSGDVDCPDCHGQDVDCPDCSGSGTQECENCGGAGETCENGVYSECTECDGEGTEDCDGCGGDGKSECEKCGGDGTVDCDECDGYGNADCDYEGCNYGSLDDWEPMMNYYYPLPSGFTVPENVHDCMENTTLIYMEEEDKYVIALTGGGMDLTWQICYTYIKLGYLPPVHFCELPRMKQYNSEQASLIVAACVRSTEIAIRDIQWKRDKLNQIYLDIVAGRL